MVRLKKSLTFSLSLLALIMTKSFVYSSYAAQVETKKSLSQLLNELSELSQTKISFSPSVADKLFPVVQVVTNNPSESLSRLLFDTGLKYRRIKDYYYVFGVPKKNEPEVKVVKTPPPPPVLRTVVQKAVGDDMEISRISNIVWDFPQQKPKFRKIVHPVQKVELKSPVLSIKTNLLYDATSSFNIGLEFAISKKFTIDLSANYNPWTFSDNRKMKHILVQPELRWWMCERFNGHFFGFHVHYAYYNWGGMLPWGFNSGKMFGLIENPDIMKHRYQGWLAGAGVSYGHYWILNNRWGIEASIGVGYAYLDYDRFKCDKCSEKIATEHKNYFGPTKASISLIYNIL